MSEIPPPIANVSRRGLLAGLGGTFVFAVSVSLAGCSRQDDLPPGTRDEMGYGADSQPNGWRDDPRLFVALGEDGTVTITCHRAEMGQGIRTSLAMVIADELEADWARVRVVQAPADEERFGNQNTDGSRSMRHFLAPMRRCGAAARAMLEEAAAKRWKVGLEEVEAVMHEVVHRPSGRRLGYGALAAAAADLDVPARHGIKLKHPSRFRYIGNEHMALVDGLDMTTGRAVYGQDVHMPGMLYAVIARPPVYGGRLQSYDKQAALAVPGVLKVVQIFGSTVPSEFKPLGGVAVIARNTYAAMKGREALSIIWNDGVNGAYDSEAYKAALARSVRRPGEVSRDEGDAAAALASAAHVIAAEYYIPHLAQAPMEPPAATAKAWGNRCEVWACVQDPQTTRDRLAKHLGLGNGNVTVHQTLLGGGFGRKSKPDFVLEAAILSRNVRGAPVKLIWTREDDLRHSYFHTASVERLEAGLDADGQAIAWRHRSAAPTIASIFAPDPKHQQGFEQGMGLRNVPFAIPNFRAETCEAPAYTRIGWFRSVSNIPHAFAVQSFVAELAAAAGRDPKDFLLELIGPDRRIDPADMNDDTNYGEDPKRYPLDTGRLKRVIEAAASGIGWGRPMPRGYGLGIAGHYSFMSYTACAIEAVVAADGTVAIPRVDIAIDCGPQINPDRIRAQMEGSVVMGVSLATSGEISFKQGRVEQGNFDDYEVTRIDAAPREIRVHLVGADFGTPPGGVGEPGLPPVAPALCNAIFAASGQRIRSLPIKRQLQG